MTMPTMLIEEPERVDSNLWPGLQRFANRLAPVIRSLPVSAPVLLSGDWGAGKTTLLLALERELAQGDPRRSTVWFDAWRYESEPALLPALMRAVWQAAPESYRNRKESRSLFENLWRLAVVVGTRVLPELLTAAGVPVVGAAMKGLTASAMAGDLAAVAGDDEAALADKTTLLWKRFSRLVAEAFDGAAPVILIDDLDRCSPDGAVALLDGIRLLVTGGADLRCNFVVALDRGVIASAIGRKFEGISGYDGNRYLEKIFPISFALPAPYEEDAVNLVTHFLGPPGDDDHHRSALKAALSDALFTNPRLIKRCINRFRLIVYFESTLPAATPAGAAGAPARDRALATWIAATERWPMLRPLIRRHDDAYWEAIGGTITPRRGAVLGPEAQKTLPALGPEAAALLMEPGLVQWLRKAMFNEPGRVAYYREAEDRIRRWGA